MSTIKPSENIGKEVQKVVQKKGKMEISFTDGTKASIDINSYLEIEKLYPGKVISSETFNKLKTLNDDASLLSYVYKITSTRLYSPFKIYKKLVEVKGASEEKAREIVDRLVSEGTIDKDLYINTFIEESLLKGISFGLIKTKLLEEGFSEKTIASHLVNFSYKDDIQMDLVLNLFSKKTQKNFRMARESVFASLFRRGYSSEKANELIDECLRRNPEIIDNFKSLEKDLLSKEIEDMYTKLKDKDMSESEKKSKIISKLLQKKYSFNDIIELLEEK